MGIQNQNYESARARAEAEQADYAAYIESPEYFEECFEESEAYGAQRSLAFSILKDEYQTAINWGLLDPTKAAEELLDRLGIKNTAGQEALSMLRDQGAKIQKIVEELEAKNTGKLVENGEKTQEFFNNWPKSGAPTKTAYNIAYKEYKETGNMDLARKNYFIRAGIQYATKPQKDSFRTRMNERKLKDKKLGAI